uniref:Spermatogenesis-associated protein 2 PUB-like domain-containing protein n=1 Tax=Knipowitschia caucasica TaxID=637954 RepID=A0AAV2KYP0_KNICA
MTMTGQRSIDLVAAYNHFLEKQIVDQGSSLPCQDATLCNEVNELLKSSDGSDAHCLGLDTLNFMEESLQSNVSDYRRPAEVRRGLCGLAKAFEVLEQAALNLHLGPWREEYKIVKMYSGIFTHWIKPVFSTQQIELLFGLLGYKQCSTQREQLHLQPQRVSAAWVDELLQLSCAFFLARCECRLLLDVLGKYAGQPRWEINIVRERQKGHSLQLALDSTLRLVDVKQPLQELPEENEMDLYTDDLESESDEHSAFNLPVHKTALSSHICNECAETL